MKTASELQYWGVGDSKTFFCFHWISARIFSRDISYGGDESGKFHKPKFIKNYSYLKAAMVQRQDTYS